MINKFTWHGHSNFQIDSNGKRLLIDPFFEGNPKAIMNANQMESIDAVLLTHDHGDHIGQTLDICKRTGATLIAMFDVAQKMIAEGLEQEQVVGMNIGGTVTFKGIAVKMVQAMHSSITGVAAGFIITLEDGYCAYHSGDTGIFSSMELFGKFHNIDLAMLPIDGHFNMDPKQAAYACKLLRCRNAIPMHWGTFPILEPTPERFTDYLADLVPDCNSIPLNPGESYSSPAEKDLDDCGCE